MNYEIRFLFALALTLAVEGTVIIISLRILPTFRTRRVSWSRSIIAGIVPSVATLPYLWFIFPLVISDYYVRIVTGEIAIIGAETVVLRYLTNLSWRKVALLSLLANIASIAAGLLVFK